MPHAPTVSEDYEARYDMETLQRAEQIKANPARLAKVKAYAAATAAELQKVAGGDSKRPAEESLMKGFRSV